VAACCEQQGLACVQDDRLLCGQIPKKLVVIGGGYIGLEFASMFRALGAEVEVFIRGPGLLRGFDKEVGAPQGLGLSHAAMGLPAGGVGSVWCPALGMALQAATGFWSGTLQLGVDAIGTCSRCTVVEAYAGSVQPALLRLMLRAVQTVEFATSEYRRRGINIHEFTSPTKIEKHDDGRCTPGGHESNNIHKHHPPSMPARRRATDTGCHPTIFAMYTGQCAFPPCSVTVHADKQRKDDPDVKDAFQTRADYCLMATGRKPNTKNLGLEEVHLPPDPGPHMQFTVGTLCRRQARGPHIWQERPAAPPRRPAAEPTAPTCQLSRLSQLSQLCAMQRCG
jgi:Pyridine nucleotide-disulphide oxidoreductase